MGADPTAPRACGHVRIFRSLRPPAQAKIPSGGGWSARWHYYPPDSIEISATLPGDAAVLGPKRCLSMYMDQPS
jgi:hypothetical protein